MAELQNHDVHVGTGAANKIVQSYGLASFIPAGLIEILVKAILQAFLQHQSGQPAAVADAHPVSKKQSKSGDD